MKSEIAILANSIKLKQNDLENLNVDKTGSETISANTKDKVKQLEEINSIHEKEIIDLKAKLEDKTAMNKELLHMCRYLEIKLDEIFKGKACDFKAIRKVNLVNHIHSKPECKRINENISELIELNTKLFDKDSRIEKLNLKI